MMGNPEKNIKIKNVSPRLPFSTVRKTQETHFYSHVSFEGKEGRTAETLDVYPKQIEFTTEN
jgi:hypothetical protein